MKRKTIIPSCVRLLSGKARAFTLAELLVVLCILGILVLTQLPNLLPLITQAKTVEAKMQLEHVHLLEKTYFYMHSKYSDNLGELGFEQAKLVKDGGNANYKIDITSATASGFKATATSITDFNGNGIFNVWEIDQEKNLKEKTPD